MRVGKLFTSLMKRTKKIFLKKLICEIESGNNMKQRRTISSCGHEINSYDKEKRKKRERERQCVCV